jgi:hypothetical protein
MPSLASFALAAFQELASAPSAEIAVHVVFSKPILLLQSMRPQFLDWAERGPGAGADGAQRALSLIDAVIEKSAENFRAYLVGRGPLEPIIRDLCAGDITEACACELAARPDVYMNLAPVYVRAISMRNQVEANERDWRNPMLSQKVIWAALDARRPTGLPEQDLLDMIASIDYAVIVARSLSDFPDGRLMADAVRRAEPLLQADPGPWHTPGGLEFSLGSLHLDPYIYKRVSSNFELQIQEWRRRPFQQRKLPLSPEDAEPVLVPEAAEAFDRSSKYFLASAAKCGGVERGVRLKGYIEAEVWKKVAGGETSPEILEAAREAKQLLDDGRHVRVLAAIDSLLQMAHHFSGLASEGGAGWDTTARRILDTAMDDLLRQHGLVEATDLLAKLAETVSSESPPPRSGAMAESASCDGRPRRDRARRILQRWPV